MKIYAAFLLILLLVLQYKFWFDKGGYFYNLQLEKQLEEARNENEKLKARNLELARRIILVKEDPNEIEHLARKNLGMIKEGEKYMFIIDETGNKAQPEPDLPPPSTGSKVNKKTGAITRE